MTIDLQISNFPSPASTATSTSTASRRSTNLFATNRIKAPQSTARMTIHTIMTRIVILKQKQTKNSLVLTSSSRGVRGRHAASHLIPKPRIMLCATPSKACVSTFPLRVIRTIGFLTIAFWEFNFHAKHSGRYTGEGDPVRLWNRLRGSLSWIFVKRDVSKPWRLGRGNLLCED